MDRRQGLGMAAAMAGLQLSVWLTGCVSPADQALDTSSQQAFLVSAEKIVPSLSTEQQRAFLWATTDLELPQLHRDYPNASPRAVIRGQARRFLARYPQQRAALQRQLDAQPRLRENLEKIRASDVSLALEQDVFGLQPVIRAKANNDSTFPVGQMTWEATLYLDGRPKAAAYTTVRHDLSRRGGLLPGTSVSMHLLVNEIEEQRQWSGLNVQTARSKRVVMAPLLASIKDLNGVPYLDVHLAARLRALDRSAAVAEQYLQL